MPIEQSQTVQITCDNPDCPGHPDLEPDARTGWLFVTHEVYGEPTGQAVYGSVDCVAADTTAKASAGATW